MNIYTQIYELVSALPLVKSWPEMTDVLQRIVGKKPRNWQLPFITCGAMGGREAQALPAAAAIACLQISIILIDDMLDDDPYGDYRRVGAPAAANMAVAFQSAAFQLIAQADALTHLQKMTISQNLNQMVFITAYGQYKDSQNPIDEDEYWHLVKTKSAPFFSCALHIGALSADAGSLAETTENVRQLGALYGEMIQIHDDLNDTMAQPADPDWLLGRSPLPILFAKLVEHPHQARFWSLCDSITAPGALTEAQNILIQCGAVSYCVSELLSRYQAAQQLLGQTTLPDKGQINALLTELVEPLADLLAASRAKRPLLP